MNVKNDKLVIVRGINDEWIDKNFTNLAIYFGSSKQSIPIDDAYYIGLYLGTPISAISHIGFVSKIVRDSSGATFHLRSIVKLPTPIKSHPIRKHEKWTLDKLKLDYKVITTIRQNLNSI